MADRVSITNFEDNFEVKNGDLGSAQILNRAVHEVKLELDTLWSWAADASDTLPSNSMIDYFINDTISYADAGAVDVTRSAQYLGNMIRAGVGEITRTDATWNCATIYSNIQNAIVSGGEWV